MLIRFLFCFEMWRGSCFFTLCFAYSSSVRFRFGSSVLFCRQEALVLWPGWKSLLDALSRGARAGCEWFKQGQQSSLLLFGLAPSRTPAFVLLTELRSPEKRTFKASTSGHRGLAAGRGGIRDNSRVSVGAWLHLGKDSSFSTTSSQHQK